LLAEAMATGLSAEAQGGMGKAKESLEKGRP
jgi:hypothetical protein